MTGPEVVLTGPPGSGKSTVGRLLARRLGVRFRDTDDDVETDAGMTIPDIFFEEGEPAFRARERDAVARALAEHAGVLSLGGGAVLDPETRRALMGHRVVFLNVPLADATRRVGLSAARPVLQMNPRAQLQLLLAERLPLYRAVAQFEVATEALSPEQVAAVVLQQLADSAAIE